MAISSNKTNAIVADFAKEAVKLCGKLTDDTKLVIITGKVDKLEKEITAAIKQERVVSGLEEVDGARDTTFSSIGYFLKGATYSPDAEVSAAAKTALADYDKYGRSITTARYEEETTYIRSYLDDTKADKYADIFKKVLGFKDWITRLESDQTSFDAKYEEFMSANAASKKSATAIKKELVALLNKCLLPYVSSLAYIDENYKAIADELDARIEHLK